MGIQLENEFGQEFDLTGTGWCFFLNLAERYGWAPVGTLPPADLPAGTVWEGRYDSSDGQLVTAGDGAVLATALTIASTDPDRHQREREIAEQMWALRTQATGLDLPIQPPESPEFMLQLAAFCRAAAFRIL